MRTCTRCILTDTGVNIDFDRTGVCNYCRAYDRYGPSLKNFGALRPLLLERFRRFRGRQPYDCIVGLSGGKDSSYVAYRITREYGLRSLLVTYDNGFLTEYARQNIRRVAEALGQDHIFLRPPAALYGALYRSSILGFAVPCVACTFPGMLWIFKLALERRIPLLIHGRSRPQMFKDLTEGTIDPFLQLIWSNFRPYDPKANKERMQGAIRKMNRLSERFVRSPELKPLLRNTFQPDPERLKAAPFAPEMLGLFLYEPYDERRQMRVLEREIGWRPPDGGQLLTHQDCVVHDAVVYLYNLAYGHPMLRQELSTMIREGDISRRKALERLAGETRVRELDRGSLDALCRAAGMTPPEILHAARSVRRKALLLKAALKAKHALTQRDRLPIPLWGPGAQGTRAPEPEARTA